MGGEGGGLVAWLKKKGCVWLVKGSGSEARASEPMTDEARASEAMGERMGGEEVSKLADTAGRGESAGRSGSGAAVADVVVLGVGTHFLPAATRARGVVTGAAAGNGADAGESEGEGEGDMTRLGPRSLQVGAGPAHLRGA
jgi:hypothetical protein